MEKVSLPPFNQSVASVSPPHSVRASRLGIFSTLRHLVLFSLNHHCRCQTQTSHVFLYRLSTHRGLSQTFRILVYSRPTHIWLVFVRAPVRRLSRCNPPSVRRTPHKLSHRLLMHFWVVISSTFRHLARCSVNHFSSAYFANFADFGISLTLRHTYFSRFTFDALGEDSLGLVMSFRSAGYTSFRIGPRTTGGIVCRCIGVIF